jgi:hypothetical protein
MNTGLKTPPINVKVDVGVPKTLPDGNTITIVWSMLMSAVFYLVAWMTGEAKTEKIARLWRLRASMARATMGLQSDIVSTYLNGRCGNEDTEIDEDSPLLKRWTALFEEYQSVFVDLEVEFILNRTPAPGPTQ